MVGGEPGAGGAGGGGLEAALLLHAGGEVGGGVVEFPEDEPGVDLLAVGGGGGKAGSEGVAVEFEARGRGEDFGGRQGLPAPGDVREDGVYAVGGQEAGGGGPVAGDESGTVVVPDADDFAGSRREGRGVGPEEEVALAAGQEPGVLGAASGEGGGNLRGEAFGLREEGVYGGRIAGSGGGGADSGDGGGEGEPVVDVAGFGLGAAGGGNPEFGGVAAAEMAQKVALGGPVVGHEDVGHPEAFGREEDGRLGLGGASGVEPAGCDEGGRGDGGDGEEVGGLLADALGEAAGGGVGEGDGAPAVGAVGLDILAEAQVHGGGQAGGGAIKNAELASAPEEGAQDGQFAGGRLGVVGEEGEAGGAEAGGHDLVVGGEAVFDAGFEEQAAGAVGGLGRDGAFGGVGAGSGTGHHDERAIAQRGEAPHDEVGGRLPGAAPGGEAEAVDAVPAGGLVLGGEVALVEDEGLESGGAEGLVGDVPAVAALEVEAHGADGVGAGAEDGQLESDGVREV